MANYDLKEESLEIPYLYSCGRVCEKEFNGVKYLVKSATEFVHNDLVSDIVVSHFKESGFDFVNNFEFIESTKELDFTWINPEDCIILKNTDDFQSVTRIKANIDNLYNSYLPAKKDKDNYMTLELNGDNTRLSLLKQVKLFNRFIHDNQDCIDRVIFNGFNPVVKEILTIYAERNNLKTDSKEEDKAKVYKKVD